MEKGQAGDFDEDVVAADLLQTHEARIAAVKRPVGKQTLEVEFLKGAPRAALAPGNVTTSVVIGSVVSPSQKGAVDGHPTLHLSQQT